MLDKLLTEYRQLVDADHAKADHLRLQARTKAWSLGALAGRLLTRTFAGDDDKLVFEALDELAALFPRLAPLQLGPDKITEDDVEVDTWKTELFLPSTVTGVSIVACESHESHTRKVWLVWTKPDATQVTLELPCKRELAVRLIGEAHAVEVRGDWEFDDVARGTDA